MGTSGPVLGWLVGRRQWPHAALFAACFLLALAPPWFRLAGVPAGLVYLQLPLYLLHQWEEHAGDRFRVYINRLLGAGREVVTPIDAFWVNALGVWAVDVVGLNLAVFAGLWLGLIPIYMTLLNGVGHVLVAAIRREYNPGLWTALGLFLPVGGWGLYAVSAASEAGWRGHAVGLGVAVAAHAIVLAYLRHRVARTSSTVQGPVEESAGSR